MPDYRTGKAVTTKLVTYELHSPWRTVSDAQRAEGLHKPCAHGSRGLPARLQKFCALVGAWVRLRHALAAAHGAAAPQRVKGNGH